MNKKDKIINETNENSIYKFINPKDNDKLSNMSGLDLQDLIVLIDDCNIKMRKKLAFDKITTFGLEFEFEKAKIVKIKESMKVYFSNEWKMVNDGSLKKGAEINSPILKDEEKSWKDIKILCEILQSLATIDQKAGGHIHVGAHILGDNKKSWINFFKIWSVYENIIYRFAYGEFATARPCLKKYAKPLSNILNTIINDENKIGRSLEDILYDIAYDRFQAVNFNNVSRYNCNEFKKFNTLEFRCPNGTLNPVIWQNNTNFFVKLLMYCKNSNYDNDLVEKRYLLKNNKFNDLKWYDEIYLDQALELCDMIFTNNLDKIYFLKQYIKSINNKKANYSKTYSLTKN